MKLLICSDIHGDFDAAVATFEAFKKEGCDRILMLGDILYHGPRNDLPEEYAPKEVISLLNEKKDLFFCVRGNCDTEVDQMVLDFPILADYALLSLGKRTLFATHGHHFNASHLPNLKEGDILLHGHTHIPIWEEHEGIYVLNPGSATIPKAGSERGYMILEENTFRWKTLDGKEYHSLTLK